MADITVNLAEEEKELLSNLPEAVTDPLQAGLQQITEQVQEQPVELEETVIEDTEQEAPAFTLEDLPPAELSLENLPAAQEAQAPVDMEYGQPYERVSDAMPVRSEFQSWGRIQEDVDTETLKDNDDWVLASALLFNAVHGADVLGRDGQVEPHIMQILNEYGSDEDTLESKLANYGLSEMAYFNWNLGSMAIDGANLAKLGNEGKDLETKWAFVYMLDQYEKVNNDWKTTWNATKATVTDVTNWLGLATFGVGTAVSFGAKKVGKETTLKLIKAAIRKNVRASALKAGLNTEGKRLTAFAVAEGAVHASAFTHYDQKIRLKTEAEYFGLEKEEAERYLDENYSHLKTGGMAVVGGLTAGTISTVLRKGIGKWAERQAGKKLDAQQEAYEKQIKEQLEEATAILNDSQTTVVTRMLQNDEPLEEILEAISQMQIKKEADDIVEEVVEEIVEEIPYVAPKLPRALSGSKPTYNYQSFNIKLNFEDDIAKALYIVGSKTPSKNKAQFMKFLEKAGIKNIQQRAAAMRNQIKKQAANGMDEVDVTYKKPLTMKKTSKKVTQKTTPNPDPRPKVNVGKVPKFMESALNILKRVKDDPDTVVTDITDELDKASYRMIDLSKVKSMVNEAFMVAQHQLLSAEAKLLNKALTDEQRATLIEEVMDLQKIADNMAEIKDHMNAYSGRDLQDIQNWILYKSKKGESLSQEAIADAHLKFYMKQHAQLVAARQVEVEEALNKGDFNKAMEIINASEQSDEMLAIMKGIEKYDPDVANILKADPQAKASFGDKYLELNIASMFNMTTIQYNTIIPALKTYTMPLLDTLVQDPLSLNAWRKTLYQYAIMGAYQAKAINSFRLAQHLEHTTLTADPARFYDGGVKNKGRFFKMWRIMTRLVAGSDAYLQEVIASSFLSAKAYDQLVTEAAEKGLRGKELREYVSVKAVSERMQQGYDKHLTEKKLRPIIEAANNMKLSGAQKEAYIVATLKAAQGREGLKTLADEDALDLVQKMLYKNKPKRVAKDKKGKSQFTYEWGKNPFRRMAEEFDNGAAAWEELMQPHPILRLILTPFWRTPVMLVNEAIRLTPALQTMHPTLVDDLAGINGVARQARATSEVMVAHSWMMYTTVKYAQGEITGSDDPDFTKRMGQTNADGLQPHNIVWSDEPMSYLRAEPIRLPTQLWIDTLENYRMRTIAQGLGKFGDEMDLTEKFAADSGVILMAFMQSVRDTQLLQGISDIVKATGETFSSFRTDEDSTEGWQPLLKYITKKMMMIVPAQPKKIQQALGSDERTKSYDAMDKFTQMLQPNHPSIPREYDWRFKVTKLHDPMISVWGFSTSDYHEVNDFTDEEKEIDEFLKYVEKNDFAHVSRNWFKAQAYFGNEDMRGLDIEYTTESGAVRTQHVYALVHEEAARIAERTGYTQKLLNIARSDKPLGTPDGAEDSPRLKDLKELMSGIKTQAIENLLRNPRYANLKKLVLEVRNDKRNDTLRN